MPGPLQGLSILVVEDEPIIVRHAMLLVEHDGLSAAILDHALGDGDSSVLCARLKQRGIPFLIYSGFERFEGACKGAPHVNKPASPAVLVAAMEGLLRPAPISN
jgi:DNA-binding response OmpR family regulator